MAPQGTSRQADLLIRAGRAAEAAGLLREHLRSNPPDAACLALLGWAELEAGDPALAVAALSQALEMEPTLPEANYHLGLALAAAGRPERARPYLARAAALDPAAAGPRFHHGQALLAAGRAGEAAGQLAEAARLSPEKADYHYHLAQALAAAGDPARAEEAFAAALALAPGHRPAGNRLAELLADQGRVDQALEVLSACLRENPAWVQGHLNLALLMTRAGLRQEAVGHLETAAALAPDSLEAALALGRGLFHAGRPREALAALDRAAELSPKDGRALLAEGECHFAMGKPELAAQSWQRALEADPGLAEGWFYLGNHHREKNRMVKAAACFAKAAELAPQSGEAHNNLAHVFMASGRVRQAQQAYRKARELLPASPAVAENHLLTLHYDPKSSLADILAASRQWAENFAPVPDQAPPLPRPRPGRRPLRVGYVSGDFRAHPVGHFLQGVLGAHDPERVTAFCYDNLHRPGQAVDPVATAIRGAVQVWRSIRDLNDAEAASLIRQDQIDLLIDLSGHTTKNRLTLFALKPAPVTATWLGYVGTIGFPAMDYIICDQWVLPPAEEPFYLEKPVRLPNCYLHFTRPAEAPPILPMPAERNGFVTFGSFNRLAKTGPQVLAAWAEILTAAPESRLFLNTPRLADPDLAREIGGFFQKAGVDPERLRLGPGGPRRELLAAYREVDLCLDPFPYGGGVTTLESLWMGAPVLTIAGDRWVAHASESILRTVGLPQLAARSPREYVRLAALLGNDPASLKELRLGLRERLAASPICDTARFTRDLEELFYAMCGAGK